MVAKLSDGGFGMRIIPVSHRMALIGAPDGLQDLGMDGCIVIASETSARFHDRTNLAFRLETSKFFEA